MKKTLKNVLIKLCKRLGETSPILIDFSSLQDGKAASDLLSSMRSARFLEPVTVNAPNDQKVLVIAPHPDDEVIGMGGVMAQMIVNGCDVDVISLTFGDDDETIDEANRCADFLGYRFKKFFKFLPKNILINDQTLQELRIILNDTKPDVIFLPFMLDDHDDHRLASELLLRACADLDIDSSKTQIWAYQVYTAMTLNAVVNITDVLPKKLKAIEHYQSRFAQRNWSHYAMGLSAFNVRFLAGNKNADYAEVFMKTDLKKYLKMCEIYFNNSAGQCYSTEDYNNHRP